MNATRETQSAPSSSIEESDPVADPLLAQYHKTRKFTEGLCQTLETEDCVIQTMGDVRTSFPPMRAGGTPVFASRMKGGK